MKNFLKKVVYGLAGRPSSELAGPPAVQGFECNSRQDHEALVRLWHDAELASGDYRYVVNSLDYSSFGCLNQFRWLSDVRFLEIGSFEGYTSNFLADNYLLGPASSLTCVDPWIDYSKATENNIKGHDHIMNEDTFLRFSQNTKRNSSRIKVCRGASLDVLQELNDSFHFVFIDGDHSTSAVWKDAVLSTRLLRKGGYLLFDDYDWSEGRSNPKPAIDLFESTYQHCFQLIPTMNNQRLFRLVREVPSDTPSLDLFD